MTTIKLPRRYTQEDGSKDESELSHMATSCLAKRHYIERIDRSLLKSCSIFSGWRI
jgi:hypothetical protein